MVWLAFLPFRRLKGKSLCYGEVLLHFYRRIYYRLFFLRNEAASDYRSKILTAEYYPLIPFRLCASVLVQVAKNFQADAGKIFSLFII